MRLAGATLFTVSATAAAFGLGALATRTGSAFALGCFAAAVFLGFIAGNRIGEAVARPLRTAATVLDAMRHEDYTHRARANVARGPVGDLLAEVNELARHLADQRARATEESALLQSVVQRVNVALLAFDDEAALRWWNPAAERLFAGKLIESATAATLGVSDWLAGPAQRAVTVPGQTLWSKWELRRGVFHRAGRLYQYVLLSSLHRMRREEERVAWQRLLRVIGHEVNNTLAPIQSMAATCRAMLREEGAAATADVERALEVIEHRSASLGRFIAEYARLARLPAPKLAPVKLGEHLRRLAALDARCVVEVVGQKEVTVFADAPLLEQALVNVLRNAIDAAVVTKGKVTVDWSVDDEDAVITIVDEGPGVENPDNLFVPLFSTKPGGSGIGLVLARNIVEAHGGELRLDNRILAAGCIAKLTIPLGASVVSERT